MGSFWIGVVSLTLSTFLALLTSWGGVTRVWRWVLAIATGALFLFGLIQVTADSRRELQEGIEREREIADSLQRHADTMDALGSLLVPLRGSDLEITIDVPGDQTAMSKYAGRLPATECILLADLLPGNSPDERAAKSLISEGIELHVYFFRDDGPVLRRTAIVDINTGTSPTWSHSEVRWNPESRKLRITYRVKGVLVSSRRSEVRELQDVAGLRWLAWALPSNRSVNDVRFSTVFVNITSDRWRLPLNAESSWDEGTFIWANGRAPALDEFRTEVGIFPHQNPYPVGP